MTSHPHLLSHYLDGQPHRGSGRMLESINPANGQVIWQGTHAKAEEIEQAIASATKAHFAWSALKLQERACYLKRFAEQVTLKRTQLADIIALETGKPFWEAHTEVSAVINKIDIALKAYQARCQTHTFAENHVQAALRYKPHGVVVVLGAFNFPAHLSNGHIVPALLAGNTVIYKPSELTPLTAAFIMQCWHDSKLPAGVINCLQGDATVGQALLEQPIHGVFFTGSYQTGKRLHQLFNERPEVILALEMGGNNPLVIDEVADIKAALYQTLLSTLITAGQRCTCARRLILPDSAFGDEFIQQLCQAFKTVKIGAPTHTEEPFMGPVISFEHAKDHLKTVKNLSALGGQALLDMKLLKAQTGLLSPGIIDMSQAEPFDEEIFAPCVQIYRYDTFDHAIKLANQTRYGLVAGLFSDKKAHFEDFYAHIQSGLINWNCATTGASSKLPFGGIKQSGNHRPSGYFASDYCAYPIASLESTMLKTPATLLPGLEGCL
ncbi:MAG: succinylglutamate-semialdehyde dehydrogenase [Legionellaceae bacterium]|nr:succinylglutamate-semialdehyde dehydrogenase [Legionellaceae bacterium]